MKKFLIILLCYLPTILWANDTVYVVGGIQHDGLAPLPTIDAGYYLSNSYLDLGFRWDHNSDNKSQFRGLEVITRAELTEWPLPGYDADPSFKGHGISHMHIGATFNWGKLTVGDVYGQFGSGLVMRLYEDRALGIDNALRGGKIEATPYKGIYLTA